MTCLHLKFSAEVHVHPLVDGGPIDETKPPDRYAADVTITCAACGEPFQFLGPEAGLSMEHPTVNLAGTTLQVPIAPGRREGLPSKISFQMPPTRRGKS